MADPVLFPRNAAAPAFLPTTGAPFVAARAGNDLLVQKDASLPDLCVKCGAREGIVRRSTRFAWTPPWVYATALAGVLIMAVLAAVLQKRGHLMIPLCAACKKRWTHANLVMGLGVFWIFVAMALMVAFFAHEMPALGFLALLSMVGVPVGVSFGYVRKRRLHPRKIDDRMLTLVGVHSDALDLIVQAAGQRAALAAPAGAIA